MDDDIIPIHDILIVGAGPCGLAVAARLRERTPSSLFTDSEHQRYYRMRASAAAKKTAKFQRVTRRSCTAHDRLLQGTALSSNLDIVVLDEKSNTWMCAWNERFRDLKITHLRSPMFFHPDPRDRDGLLEFAYRGGRETELREIGGVIGKSLSKHQRKKKIKTGGKCQETVYLDERDRNDYYRRSQSIFHEYCDDVVSHYCLSNLVEKSQVISIKYDRQSPTGVFTVETSTGIKKARIVVFAAGSALKPALPIDSPFYQANAHGSVSHVFSTVKSSQTNLFPPHILQKVQNKQPTSIVVVGGGLTSAQITAAAASAGISKVYHLMRGPLKVKHFDVSLPWVGKYKNYHLASFWSADDDEERWEMIKEARGGGSITPEYKNILTGLIKQGKLELKEYTTIIGAKWDEEARIWKLETDPAMDGLVADHITYATGVPVKFEDVPILNCLQQTAPIKTVGGMPCLTSDLMWNEETPFFFTGRLAGLRLGPWAGNLEGARQGAERIAWKVSELVRERNRNCDGEVSGYVNELDQDGVDYRRIGIGLENQFHILDTCKP